MEPTQISRGEALVKELVEDANQPVVVFSRGFCGYCTAVKNLFNTIGVNYRTVEVDGPEFREAGLYGEIRDSLFRRTGRSTLPQVFIGGEPIGGYMETYSLYSEGELQEKLAPFGFSSGFSPD